MSYSIVKNMTIFASSLYEFYPMSKILLSIVTSSLFPRRKVLLSLSLTYDILKSNLVSCFFSSKNKADIFVRQRIAAKPNLSLRFHNTNVS